MSAGPRLSPATFALRALVLLLCFGAMLGAARIAPAYAGSATPVAALGFLLLGGVLLGQLVEPLRLPHLTGYLLAGMLAGPHGLGMIGHETVGQLQVINALALALISFSAGAELTVDMLRRGLRGLLVGAFCQSVLLFAFMVAVFLLARPLLPFARSLPGSAALGVALLWATVAIVKSPAATLGVLAETGARGPLARYALGMVVVLDVIVLLLFTVTVVVARGLIEGGARLSLADLTPVGHEVVASIAVGTTLGLLVAAYLWQISAGLPLFLVAVGYGATELARFFGYDPMLIFVVAGFVVQNLSEQGKKLLHAIERSGQVVFVVFFANAGAHLDLHALRTLWPVALLLFGGRAVGTVLAARLGSRIARDEEVVRRYGAVPLLSQAGVAIGIAVAIASAFPSIGEAFRSLAIAVVGINEAIGPVLFKLALDRAGETRRRGDHGDEGAGPAEGPAGEAPPREADADRL